MVRWMKGVTGRCWEVVQDRSIFLLGFFRGVVGGRPHRSHPTPTIPLVRFGGVWWGGKNACSTRKTGNSPSSILTFVVHFGVSFSLSWSILGSHPHFLVHRLATSSAVLGPFFLPLGDLVTTKGWLKVPALECRRRQARWGEREEGARDVGHRTSLQPVLRPHRGRATPAWLPFNLIVRRVTSTGPTREYPVTPPGSNTVN